MILKILLGVLGTIVALLIASTTWVSAFGGGANAIGVAALKAMTLRSPFWWLMNAAIIAAAGWVLRRIRISRRQ